MSQTTLHIAEQDNVMVALRLIAGGTQVDGVTVASDVPAGHKIATRPIPAGATVLKYGYPIGVATRDPAHGFEFHSIGIDQVVGRVAQITRIDHRAAERTEPVCVAGIARDRNVAHDHVGPPDHEIHPCTNRLRP